MCGLAGIIVGPSARVGADALRRMGASLRHRGPDDEGYVLWTPGDIPRVGRSIDGVGTVGLVHRRLSILDLSEHGWQPMVSADRRHMLVYNGEIYNYVELRRELEKAGRQFVSHGDTEVLLESLIHWGVDGAVDRIEGMYAFALLDTATSEVTLGRDPFGIKPLYYAHDANRFMFASEIKALLTVADFPRAVNPKSMLDYLADGVCDHGEQTMFAGVYQLPLAAIVTLDVRDVPRVIKQRITWTPNATYTVDLSRDDAVRLVRDAFLGNVGRHLRSDVPVGAALSGGLDSSSILAAMRLVEPNVELHAFSYFADDSRLNEERWVRAAATAASAEVHSAHLSADSLAKDVDDLIYAQDEPFSGTTVYAQYSVFRAVHAADIRVVLDGQGADELLGGYAMYLGPHMADLAARRAWGALTQLVRSSRGRADVSMMTAARYAIGASTPAWVKRRLRRHIRTALFPGWLNGQWFDARGATADRRQPDPGPHLRAHLVTSLRSFLPSLLRYEDRNSMAFSVESRVPFLTTRFADLVLSLPDDYLISPDGTRKAVFRDAMRGIVPDMVIERRDKLGFHTPEQALLEAAHSWADRVLASETARRLPGIRPEALQQAASLSRNGTHAPKIPLWRILNLIRWAEIFDVRFPEQ